MSTIAPYGSWRSPITTDLITRKAVGLMEIAVEVDYVYWLESHPWEGGRYTIMRQAAGKPAEECTPSEFNVRTTVHEYGGGAYAVHRGTIFFADFRDQRLYRQRPGAKPTLLTPGEGYRYADIIIDDRRDRLICIREDHTARGEATNTIVAVSPQGGENGEILATGSDFFSSPRLSPDGAELAYLQWNHPNMPWDGCELWVSKLGPDGRVGSEQRIAGGASESIFQPEWSPDGILHFVSDSTGWWNLYRWLGSKVEPLCRMSAEFGDPQWQFAMSTYGFIDASTILCTYSEAGLDHLARLDLHTGQLKPIAPSLTDISCLKCGHGNAFILAGSPTEPSTLWELNADDNSLRPIRRSFERDVDDGYLSVGEPITFATTDGDEAHAIYYPPRNRDYAAPEVELPPLLVACHGGPTGSTTTALRYPIQYWTSRGFAVVDVNYRGSSGYGREYRQRLNGNWGIVDVDDCCNAARFLAEKGLVDSNRLAIRGGSAGGYTTLACLVFRSDVFDAGASHYGLADLERFVGDTHKFESRYLGTLIGPYPEKKDVYFQRSPIHFTQNLAAPLILFQGDEDKVVPPNQSEMMYEALRRKGIPVAYLLFAGEQHGFRRAENIKRSLEAELFFYSRVFGFSPADSIDPVTIENL
jgi:dipeptidyl aminopeptidase/acylaminoacyl peptidase